MSKAHPGKIVVIIVMLFIGVAVTAGYYSFSHDDTEAPDTVASMAAAESTATDDSTTAELIAPQTEDVIYGKADAPVTIIDYSSLSCPHCAHFHNEVLPDLQKEFIESGKAKLVYRHFPLNEPSLRAAQLVNCASQAQKPGFIKVLFDKQGDWSFTEDFLKELKQIAALGGVDNAAFDACIASKAGEDRILEIRKQADTIGKVQSTPSFFINGVPLNASPTIEHFREAIAKAGK